MRIQRTEQEEVIHQLRKINAQLNPLPAFIKLGLWLGLLFFVLALPSFVFLLVSHGFEHQPVKHQIAAHHPH